MKQQKSNRNKPIQINFRVTKEDKIKIEKLAQKSKLPVSNYLTNCALNKAIIEMPNENFIDIYNELNALKYEINYSNSEQISNKLEQILVKFREIYSGGTLYGNYKNMEH